MKVIDDMLKGLPENPREAALAIAAGIALLFAVAGLLAA